MMLDLTALYTDSTAEIELSGTPDALQRFAERLRALAEPFEADLRVPEGVPHAPYYAFLRAVRVSREGSALKVARQEGMLLITGTAVNLEALAHRIAWLAEESQRAGRRSHILVEHHPGDRRVAPDTLSLVVAAVPSVGEASR